MAMINFQKFMVNMKFVHEVGKTRKKRDFIQFKYIIIKCICYTIICVYIVLYIYYMWVDIIVFEKEPEGRFLEHLRGDS